MIEQFRSGADINGMNRDRLARAALARAALA